MGISYPLRLLQILYRIEAQEGGSAVNDLLKRASNFISQQKRNKLRYRLLSVMGVIVVFITTYMLILPGITMERKTICGLEEHTHSEECYTYNTALVCGLEENDEHTHTEECYETSEELICGLEEHTHTEECYESDIEVVVDEETETETEEITETEMEITEATEAEAEETTDKDAGFFIPDTVVSSSSVSNPTDDSEADYDQPKYSEQYPDEPDNGITVPDEIISGGGADADTTVETHSEDYVEEYTETTTDSIETDGQDKFICGLEEHTHSTGCYNENGELVCGYLEHRHDSGCLSCDIMPLSIEQVINSANYELTLNHDLSYTLTVHITNMGPATIPTKVMEQGEFAGNESRLKKVIFDVDAPGMMIIRERAFEYCTSLEEVVFDTPENMIYPVTIEGAAFSNCVRLSKINFENIKINSIGYATRTGNVEDMASGGAFYNTALRDVNIVNGISTYIGDFAFYGCKELKSFRLGSGTLNQMGIGIFQNCTSLEEIDFSAISSYSVLFQGYTGNNNNNVAVGTFKGCTSLKRVIMPERYNFSSNGGAMFYGCTSLSEIDFNGVIEKNFVWELGDWSLMNTESLKSVDLTRLPSLGKLSNRAFNNSGLESVAFPVSLGTITGNAFENCKRLSQLIIPEDSVLTTIEGYAFSKTALKSLDFSKLRYLKTIKNRAFDSCSTLSKVILPPTVEEIRDFAFSNMPSLSYFYVNSTNLKTVTRDIFTNVNTNFTMAIGKDSKSITSDIFAAGQKHIGRLVFEGENELEITGDTASTGLPAPLDTIEAGKYFVSAEGDLYKLNDDKTAMLVYACENRSGSFEIPEAVGEDNSYNVTAVDDYALSMSKVSSVTFENIESITSVSLHAFAECMSLKSVQDCTTVEAALEIFKDKGAVSVTFYNTGLEGAPSEDMEEEEFFGTRVDGRTPIKIYEGLYEIFSDKEELLTGEQNKIRINVSQDGQNRMLRLYFRCSKDCLFTDNISESNNVPVTYHKVENTDYHYYEIGPVPSGQTIPISLDFSYPNGKPDNSTLYVWGVGGNNDSFAGYDGKVILPTDDLSEEGIFTNGEYHKTVWNTIEYHYPIEKIYNSADKVKMMLSPDGKKTLANLGYWVFWGKDEEHGGAQIGANRSLASDYVNSIDIEDTFTLPTYISWREGIKEAKKNGNYRCEFVSEGGGVYVIYVTIDEEEYELVRVKLNNGNVSVAGGVDFEINEDNTITLKWEIFNKNNTYNGSEMGNPSIDVIFGPKVLIFDEESYKKDNPDTAANVVLKDAINKVDCNENYYYAESWSPEEYTVKHDIALSSVQGDITLKKIRVNEYDVKDPSGDKFMNFGDDDIFRITAENNSAFNCGELSYFEDNLNKYHYIRPSDMEKMFKEASDEENRYEFIIKNAFISDSRHNESVVLVDGRTTDTLDVQYSGDGGDYISRSYSDTDRVTDKAVITISQDAENADIYNINIVYGDVNNSYTIGKDKDYSSIDEALDALGFVVTEPCTYTVRYYTEGLDAGSSKEFNIYSSFKNTFMLLVDDRDEYYGSTEDTSSSAGNTINDVFIEHADNNSVSACKEDSGVIKNAGISSNLGSIKLRPEITLQKAGTIDGKTDQMGNDYEFNNDTVWDYDIVIFHNNDSGYDDVIPVTDYMEGVSAFLAPVEDNRGAEWTSGLKVYTNKSDNKDYYVLMPDEAVGSKREFRGVMFGDYYADRITVERLDNGEIATTAKWYIKDFLGANFTCEINYKVYSDIEFLKCNESSMKRKVFNRGWMGDRPSHRLYDFKGGYSFALKFDKKIVTEKGSRPALDILDSDDFSRITRDTRKVTYRLEFKNEVDNAPQILRGSDFFDILPYNDGFFEWRYADNISIEYCTNGANINIKNGSSEISPNTVSDGREIYIDSRDDVTGTTPDIKQQYMRWKNTFSAEFPDTSASLYIYVTLDFPGDTPEQWQEYMAAHGTDYLTNTLEAWEYPKSVSHELSDPGLAFLQKGVYETGRYTMYNANIDYSAAVPKPSVKTYYRGQDRFTYQNDIEAAGTTLSRGMVAYYTIIKNSSSTTRLYLSTIYDQLPKGFTFFSLRNNPDINPGDYYNSWAGVGCVENIKDNVMVHDSSRPELAVAAPGSKIGLNGDYPMVKAKRVESRNGHVIMGFDIECDKGTPCTGFGYDAMKDKFYLEPGYYVQFGYECLTGPEYDSEDTAVNAAAMELYNSGMEIAVDNDTAVNISTFNKMTPNNDGERYLWDNSEARNHGFTSGNNESMWIASDVTVYRGNDIVPGIEKKVTSTGSTVDTGHSVTKGNTVTWTVKEYNDGTGMMDGYTFTDTLEFPQYFKGNVTYNSYSRDFQARTKDSYEDGRLSWMNNNYLLKFGDWQNIGKDNISVTLTTNRKDDLVFNAEDIEKGTPKEGYFDIKYGYNQNALERPASVALKKNVDSMTLTIDFPKGEGWAIAPNGYVEMTVQSNNATGVYNSDPAIYNTAVLKPNASYDEGAVINGENIRESGANAGVRAIDYISSDISSPTSSEMEIDDCKGQNNHAKGSESKNKIVIKDKNEPVEYTLTVNNSEDLYMNWLVLISNLPEIGDANTISESISRGSEFLLSLYKDPGFSCVVKLQDGTEMEITPVIQYSTKTTFGESDWQPDGNSDWKDYREGLSEEGLNTIRSVRLVITEKIPPGAVITFKYKAIADEKAKPGETAWNTFGYRYERHNPDSIDATTMEQLFATPLKVGVSIPTVPELTKTLVNKDRKEITASEDTTFSYIIYLGEAMSFSDYTQDTIAAALTADSRAFTKVTLNVPAGSGVSEAVDLNSLYQWHINTEGVIEQTDTPWNWSFDFDAKGNMITQSYSIVELTEESSKTYSYNSTVVGSRTITQRNTSFTYNPASNINIRYMNSRENWGYGLIKTDETGEKVLEGAVFGLYSPDVKELLSDDVIRESGFEPDYVRTIVHSDSGVDTTYYLSRIDITDNTGRILCKDVLGYDRYLLKELKPPDGYYTDEEEPEYRVLDYSNRVEYASMEIKNIAGTPLPETGGYGLTDTLKLLALLLMSFSAVTFIFRYVRRNI